MKASARQAAIELRRAGMTVAAIVRELKVSRTSVCVWTQELAHPKLVYTNAERARKNRENSAKRYAERRQRVDRIKLEQGCIDCGYNKHPAGLQFDHVDKAKKKFQISPSLNRNWEILLAEIEKCVVRCAICHAIKTFEMKDNRRKVSRG